MTKSHLSYHPGFPRNSSSHCPLPTIQSRRIRQDSQLTYCRHTLLHSLEFDLENLLTIWHTQSSARNSSLHSTLPLHQRLHKRNDYTLTSFIAMVGSDTVSTLIRINTTVLAYHDHHQRLSRRLVFWSAWQTPSSLTILNSMLRMQASTRPDQRKSSQSPRPSRTMRSRR